MQIAFGGIGGNTGKSTGAVQMAVPLMPARCIHFENLNTNARASDVQVHANKFRAVAAELAVCEPDQHFVLDIGASTVIEMCQQFSWLGEARDDIAFWVVPVVPGAKSKMQAILTVKTLGKIGVPESRIVMVLNKIDDVESIERDFSEILALRNIGVNVAEEAILNNDIFETIKDREETVFDIAEGPFDFKTLLQAARASGNQEDLIKLGERKVLRMAAASTARNLRAVFNSTPIPAALAASAIAA